MEISLFSAMLFSLPCKLQSLLSGWTVTILDGIFQVDCATYNLKAKSDLQRQLKNPQTHSTFPVFHNFWQESVVSKGRCQSLSIVCKSLYTHRDGKVLCLSLKTPSLSDYWRQFLAGVRKPTTNHEKTITSKENQQKNMLRTLKTQLKIH